MATLKCILKKKCEILGVGSKIKGKSGKSQGMLRWMISGNPEVHIEKKM